MGITGRIAGAVKSRFNSPAKFHDPNKTVLQSGATMLQEIPESVSFPSSFSSPSINAIPEINPVATSLGAGSGRIAGEVEESVKKPGLFRRGLGMVGGVVNSPLLWMAPSVAPMFMGGSSEPQPEPGMTALQKRQSDDIMYRTMLLQSVRGM